MSEETQYIEASVHEVTKPLTHPAIFEGTYNKVRTWLNDKYDSYYMYVVWIAADKIYMSVTQFLNESAVIRNKPQKIAEDDWSQWSKNLSSQFLSKKTDDFDGDSVNHPSHYNQYKGLEIIQLTEQMNFNRGNAVKYIARAGFKAPEKELEDLKKARWYVDREIGRLEGSSSGRATEQVEKLKEFIAQDASDSEKENQCACYNQRIFSLRYGMTVPIRTIDGWSCKVCGYVNDGPSEKPLNVSAKTFFI
jgi:hypothetical protein